MFPNSIAAFGIKSETISRDQYAADFQQQTRNINTMLQMQRALAFNDAAQSIPNNTATALTFNTKTYDVAEPVGIHSTSTNPTRFTALNNGWYLATAQVGWAASTAGTYRQIQMYKNGAAVVTPQFRVVVHPSKAQDMVCQIVAHIDLQVTDYIQFFVQQDTGGSLNTLANDTWGALSLLSRL